MAESQFRSGFGNIWGSLSAQK